MTVPYSFANATVSIPLSQLDSNFNTPVTLGNTAIQLGNTVTTLNNMTLANVTISSGNVTITNVTVTTANVTTLNAATVIATTANVTTANITTGNVTTANIVTANITTGNVTNMSSGNVTITGGSINGTTLGASTASTANVTTLTTSSTVTINGGTANGVAYLNGSKVLTTGSALTFDGVSLGIGGVGTSDGRAVFYEAVAGSGAAFYSSGGNSAGVIGTTNEASTSNGLLINAFRSGGKIAFNVAGSEQMRLTSTGLGIGTSSPSYSVQSYGTAPAIAVGGTTYLSNAATVGASFILRSENTSSWAGTRELVSFDSVGNGADHRTGSLSVKLKASAAASSLTEYLNINAVSGTAVFSNVNLGLGVTPSAWSAFKAFEIASAGNSVWSAGSNDIRVASNYVYNGGAKFAVNGRAAMYEQGAGIHYWYTSSTSGTAGNAISFTQAMTLDASGNLLVGTTSTIAGAKVSVVGNVQDTLVRFQNQNATAPGGLDVHYSNAATNDANNWFYLARDSGATRFYVRSDGGIANYSANDVNLSDRLEKTNFAPAKDYLDTICAIPVQTFNYIDQSENNPGLTLGVVAQDVQAVAPELVMESNWGTEDDPKMRLSIYQTDLQYALMKCIQELKAQNDDLRARVAALEAK